MFDIGFSELMVIAVVALIVIGPEKLPKVARTVGHLFGRMQRYVNDVKSDISREMALDDLRKLQSSMQETAQSIEQSVTAEVRSAETEMNKIAADVPADTAEATPPAVPEVPAATDPAKPA
jgi:sec-independent protein translocase protein TatB